MSENSTFQPVLAPRLSVVSDSIRLVEWRVPDGSPVRAGQRVAEVESAEAHFDIDADVNGWLFQLVSRGCTVPTGQPIAVIAPKPERPAQEALPSVTVLGGQEPQIVTRKAAELMQQHGLTLEPFVGLKVVRVGDVEAVLGSPSRPATSEPRRFGQELLDANADWEAVYASEEFLKLRRVLTDLRRRERARFNRHVPTGEVLYDRTAAASDNGFGDGSTLADSAFVLGRINVGRNTQIGPFCVLDATHAPLEIGDHCTLSPGVQIHTHNMIEQTLTGHRAELVSQAVRIGNCCYLGPNVVVAMGSQLGDQCYVAAGSVVQGHFPAKSYLSGNPARRVGTVEVQGDRARLRLDPQTTPTTRRG